MEANQSQEQIEQIIEVKKSELKTIITEESNKLYQIFVEELQRVQTKLPTGYALETLIVFIANHLETKREAIYSGWSEKDAAILRAAVNAGLICRKRYRAEIVTTSE